MLTVILGPAGVTALVVRAYRSPLRPALSLPSSTAVQVEILAQATAFPTA